MIFITNDIHGSDVLMSKVFRVIEEKDLGKGDILVINGDGAGARGPIMNEIVKIYYEVRRGETPIEKLLDAIKNIIGVIPQIPSEWIYQAVHAGMFRKLMAEKYEKFADCLHRELKEVLEKTLLPFSKLAAEKGFQIYYVPGNGEIVPDDFTTDDITVEKTVEPEQRYYQQLAREGYFRKFNIEYVPYACKIWDGDGAIVMISTHLLDLSWNDALTILSENHILDDQIAGLIVHYPPAISPIGSAFPFWTPNAADVSRTDRLMRILDAIAMQNGGEIFFGHIHLGPTDTRMEPLPAFMGFEVPGLRNACIWIKPGTILGV